ncbi:MAG TPA: guanosine-5'-triphosphate,3'-diphosphate pyrophosphatase [Aliidiomarina sp.]|nr:guanosine-5'-triphosphate,3'-diphosphate pyrophosphatase [Aliidiomarina sp.]
MRSNQYYVAIDLGSNSFHMLIVRVVAGSVRIIAKIKRRIRLAEGIQSNGTLAPDIQQRALDCLAIFADRVSDIAPENIRAVGTATLRKINPNDPFITRMQETLGHPIQIISGEVEAETIYQGVAHTSATQSQLMVCDIGGASTEIAIGNGFQPCHTRSLDMGCVTWMTTYFPQGVITKENVAHAIAAAEQLISPHKGIFIRSQKTRIVGASGTFKALQDIAIQRGSSERFRLPWLETLLTETMQFESLNDVAIDGLKTERALVFLPGLCILIALFRQLNLKHVETTEAALREGLIYSMLTSLQHNDVQLRTLKSLAEHYQIDREQTERVGKVFSLLSADPSISTALPKSTKSLARAVAFLHEIGQSLSYKYAGKHSRYVLKHTNLPGFSLAERSSLLLLLEAVTGIIDDDNYPKELSESAAMALLSRVLRISIICCQRRRDDAIPKCSLTLDSADTNLLILQLPPNFLSSNPYLASLLNEESRFQQSFGGLLLRVN